jgi:hypothetical protein
MLLIGPFFAFDAVLGLAYLNAFSALLIATVVVVSLVGGSGYGILIGRRIIRSLQERGLFRPSRKELFLVVLAVIVVVAGFLWLVVSFGSVVTDLMMVVIYSFLPATFVTEGIVLLRWEKSTGRRVEYEGLWAIKAQNPNLQLRSD